MAKSNWLDRKPSSFNVNPAARTWIVARTVVNIKTVFPLRRNLDFYLDVNNVLRESERATVRGNAGRPILHQYQTQQFLFGINGRI